MPALPRPCTWQPLEGKSEQVRPSVRKGEGAGVCMPTLGPCQRRGSPHVSTGMRPNCLQSSSESPPWCHPPSFLFTASPHLGLWPQLGLGSDLQWWPHALLLPKRTPAPPAFLDCFCSHHLRV